MERSDWRKLVIRLLLPAIILAGGTWSFLKLHTPAVDPETTRETFFTVAPRDLTVTLIKDGELQAIHNLEIRSEVENPAAIQTLVEEGASVRKGDILLTLDSSAIADRIEDTSLRIERVQADLTTALELRRIQENQNAADLEAARVGLILAEIALRQFEDGTYPQQFTNARMSYEAAEMALNKAQETLARTRSLYHKDFVTATAVKNDELTVTTAQNSMRKAETALRVLRDYNYQMTLTSRQSSLAEAEKRVDRTIRINAANLSQRDADVRARQRTLQFLQKRMEHLQHQMSACTIRAPEDGLVIYGSTGDRWARTTLQIGSLVRREQLLFRLPGTSGMKAVVYIPEAQINQLYTGMYAQVRVVGQPLPIDAAITRISVLPNGNQLSFNPDLKEYVIELTLSHTDPQLKPGISLQAEMYIDELTNVTAVPLAAIHSAGADSYVFVKNGDSVEARSIRVGRTTEDYAQVIGDGVKEGEQVLHLGLGRGAELLARAGVTASTVVSNDREPSDPGRKTSPTPTARSVPDPDRIISFIQHSP